jgi:hypothetical protein
MPRESSSHSLDDFTPPRSEEWLLLGLVPGRGVASAALLKPYFSLPINVIFAPVKHGCVYITEHCELRHRRED